MRAGGQSFSTGRLQLGADEWIPRTKISPAHAADAWRDEFRATMTLAWPLILANVTQQAIQATDVLLMGRLGATQLAAATLALNLTFTVNVLLLGLLTAASPMMATALGKRSNAVRDVRRTFRAGLWLLFFTVPPYWLLLWHAGSLMLAMGQPPELASQGQTFLRAYMWCTAPWLLFQLLRHFLSALERPRVILWLSISGIALNALLSWALIFGHFGLPALGLVGGGLGSSLTWLILCAALIVVVSVRPHLRRFHLFGNWWRFDGERTLAMARLGWPIGVTPRPGDGRVRARRLFHGLDRRAGRRRPRGRISARGPDFHGAARARPGSDGARRSRARSR